VTPREGHACAICGYPVAEPDADLCDQCTEWQRVATEAEAAINFNEQRTAGAA
jgi:hypothetical protein